MKKRNVAVFVMVLFIVLSSLCNVSFAADNGIYAKLLGNNAQSNNMTARLVSGAKPHIETKDGTPGWRLDASVIADSYIKCNIDDSVLYNLPYTANVRVSIDYYDDNYGGFALYYDADSGKRESRYVQLENTGEWKRVNFILNDARFANGINNEDFYIITNDTPFAVEEKHIMGVSCSDVLIGGVSVELKNDISPYDINMDSGKFGNIFYEGEDITFDITLNDRKNIYTSGEINFTVKSFDGQNLFMFNRSFEDGKCKITLSDMDFGVYILHMDIFGGNVSQSADTNFSYSKKAEHANSRFGVATHLDWAVNDKKSIMGIIDSAKNAGYKFIRDGISHRDTEKQEGVLKLLDSSRFMADYAYQKGENLALILTCDNSIYDSYPYKSASERQCKGYEDFCNYVVNELKGKVKYYIYENEFNLTSGGVHHPDYYDAYLRLVKSAYNGIRRADENVYLVSGGIGRYEKEYIKNCFDNGILDYCDALSVHVYDQVGGPETWYIYPTIKDHRDTLKERNPIKQAWITETGWPSKNAQSTVARKISHIDYLAQARYYARSLGIHSDPSRIDVYMHYQLVDNYVGYFNMEDNYGIMESHDSPVPHAAKPAYVAVAAFNSILDGYKFKEEVNGASNQLMNNPWYLDNGYTKSKYTDANFKTVFENEKGDNIYMLWRQESASGGEYTIESDKKYFEIYDLFGNKTVVKNTDGCYRGQYDISPVYVHATNDYDGTVKANNDRSVWSLNDKAFSVTAKLPPDTPNKNIKIIAAGYDKNGQLCASSIKTAMLKNCSANAQFNEKDFSLCEKVKLFTFDSMSNLKPITENEELLKFGNSKDIECIYTVSGLDVRGTFPGNVPRTELIITVLADETSKKELMDDYNSKIIYQNTVRTNENGNFRIDIPIENFGCSKVKVIVSSRETDIQTTVDVE